jgi:hypothetical protein
MKTPILVIFVDAYPFSDSEPLAKKLNAVTYKKVTPGVGYSINVKAEIFAKLKPDDVGYFCEWIYNKEKVHKWMTPTVVSFLTVIGSISNFSNRVLHKLVRMIIKEPIYSIPFDILPYMKNAGLTAYERNFPQSTFLTKLNFERVLYSDQGVNDIKVFSEAKALLKEEEPARLFVGTAELDGIMHHYGKSSDKYKQQIELIDKNIFEIVEQFKSIHGEGSKYFIFSDHGMSDVDEGVPFDIRKVLGRPGKDTYSYFIDATFFRVWLNNNELKKKLIEAFIEVKQGHVLSKSERNSYGLNNVEHGDVIFLLDEGKMFSPSFFGKDICKSMHGYDPTLESQQGTIISNFDSSDYEYVNAPDIYDLVMASSNAV